VKFTGTWLGSCPTAQADKVLVLHDGKVVEFGPPKALMARRDGAFRQMVSAASHT